MDDFIGTHKRDETPKYIVQLLVPKTYFFRIYMSSTVSRTDVW